MSLINKEIVDFKVQAFVDGEFREITKADVLGKWSVFFFYPADFTFVCPTELEDLADKNKLDLLKAKIKLVDIDKLATKLNAGVFTVKDILDALTKPGRDPREDLPAPLTRQNIIKLEDIKVGTIMRGTVRNITDFGVFVDIGIKTAGLIHISELSNKHVKHPLDVVSVGDILNVLVISVDAKRNRIGLSLKQVTKENNNVLA